MEQKAFKSKHLLAAEYDNEVAALLFKYSDLQGRQVTNPQHGLYIINGKKFVR